jgi:hypothetical protein
VPHDCADGFLHAYWRRPEAHLDPTLESGEWAHRNAALLELDALDAGYRLLVHG